MKNAVTFVVKQDGKNYGFSVVVKSSVRRIEEALNQAYGKENILVCIIREV